MPDFKLLTFDPVKHHYYYDKVQIPSVSAVIGMKCVHPRLNEWIRNAKLDKAIWDAKEEKTVKACTWGTDRHQDIEDLLKLAPGKATFAKWLDDQVERLTQEKNEAGTIGAAKIMNTLNAMKFMKARCIYPRELETKTIGINNSYAGTADLLGESFGHKTIKDGELSIDDWKSNDCTMKKFKMYKVENYKLQISAYSKPRNIKRGHIVHTATGFIHEVTAKEMVEAYAIFRELLELWHGRGLHRDSKAICDLWNEGLSVKQLLMDKGYDYQVISDTIKYYSF